ncbi:hypothetical protein GCM10010840_18600 [Deinococcus aerolatus]|uniref:Uncharacterized protein n=1 Tax=Deinococcus aerolatus TaxID=522487 RepID=A0ABQ2G933_9DEIO|nr:hypothetical protein GCM10010840_18600 [Deinococcus aerolatus]
MAASALEEVASCEGESSTGSGGKKESVIRRIISRRGRCKREPAVVAAQRAPPEQTGGDLIGAVPIVAGEFARHHNLFMRRGLGCPAKASLLPPTPAGRA